MPSTNLGTRLVSRAENTHSSPILIHTSKREGGEISEVHYISFHYISFRDPALHPPQRESPWGISATLTHTHTHIWST